jgi:hypothetical protein
MTEPLLTIFAETKTIPVMAEWVVGDAGALTWLAPLAVGGATVSGLRLRVRAMKHEPQAAVTAQLEYIPAGKGGSLDRIDWRPVHRHNNKGIGPDQYKFITQNGSHHHQFALNVKDNGLAMRKGNLPIAIPIASDPVNFDELLDFIGRTYNIDGVANLLPPEWVSDLF